MMDSIHFCLSNVIWWQLFIDIIPVNETGLMYVITDLFICAMKIYLQSTIKFYLSKGCP